MAVSSQNNPWNRNKLDRQYYEAPHLNYLPRYRHFSCHAQDLNLTKANLTYERTIKSYFDGWANKDWNLVNGQLAHGFTFTSAAPDEHVSVEKFKEKCRVQSAHIKDLNS